MTTTSAMPVLRAATTGPAPAVGGTTAQTAPTPDLAATFTAMISALTAELAGLDPDAAAAAIGEEPVGLATDGAEPPAEGAPGEVAATDGAEPPPEGAPGDVAVSALASALQAAVIVPAASLEVTEAWHGHAAEPAGPLAAGESATHRGAHVDALGPTPVPAGDTVQDAPATSHTGEQPGQPGARGDAASPVPPTPGRNSPPAPVTPGIIVGGADAGPALDEPGAPALAGLPDAAASGPAEAPVLPHVPGPTGAASDPAAGIGAPGGVAAVARVAGINRPSAPAPAVGPALPEQLVTLVAPLRQGPDGTHRMSIELRPEELGGVKVDVRILGNEISLHLRADLSATTELLRASLADLRSELEMAGFDAGSLDVGSNTQEGPDSDRPDARRTGATDATAARSQSQDAPSTAAPASGIDIRL